MAKVSGATSGKLVWGVLDSGRGGMRDRQGIGAFAAVAILKGENDGAWTVLGTLFPPLNCFTEPEI